MLRRKEPSIPNDILDQLLAGTDAAAALSQSGLLDTLKKAFAERALNAEMDHHLGHDDQVGNNRNGYGRKTVATDSGRIEIEVPRDRASSFDPQLIAKYQRRFPGFDDKIISMYARHDGGDGDLFRFPRIDELLIFGAQIMIEANGDQRCHVDCSPK